MDLVVSFLLGSIALSSVIIAAHVSLIYKRLDYFIDVFNDLCVYLTCEEDDEK